MDQAFHPIPWQAPSQGHGSAGKGETALESIGNPFERAAALFLFGCRHQFFFEGNLRTSWLAMEGVLLSNCIDPIDVPADKTSAFNGEMAGFLESGDGTGMMRFLAGCQPVRRPDHSRP